MENYIAISQQHYLFGVQAFAQTVLSLGGDSYSYSLRDRSTRGVLEDVACRKSDVGVIMKIDPNDKAIKEECKYLGLKFKELAVSAPRIALPVSHPLSNASSLTLDQLKDWPYLYFEQGDDDDIHFAEEALSWIPRSKKIACTDRATLTELASAVNGYTVTSGILVGIADGPKLTTIPLECDVQLHLGIVFRKGEAFSPATEKFIEVLNSYLSRYCES